MQNEGFPGFEDENELIPGAMYEVPGPRPAPTGSRIETSTEIYAAGFPLTEINSWTVQEAKRRRAERFGDSPTSAE